MGKRAFAVLLTTVSIALCGFIPDILLSQVPRVTIARMSSTVYTGDVNCGGELVSADAREITLELPMITSDVQVSVGDRVTAGQVLASVDRQETFEALLNQNIDLSYLDIASLLGKYGSEELAKELEEYLAKQLASIEDKSLSLSSLPSQIVSPIDGVVTAVSAQNNSAITPLQPAFVVTPDERMQAVVRVQEVDIASVRVGQSAQVVCAAMRDRPYAATVIAVSPAASKILSGTTQETVVEVTLRIDEPDEYLKSGYTVSATIFTSEPETIFLLPYEAVQQADDGQEYVYVFYNGVAQRRNVELGMELTQGIQILQGIHLWDCLITEPQNLTGEACAVFLRK